MNYVIAGRKNVRQRGTIWQEEEATIRQPPEPGAVPEPPPVTLKIRIREMVRQTPVKCNRKTELAKITLQI